MNSHIRLTVTALLWSLFIGSTQADPMKVVMLTPDPPGNAFWDSVVSFMHAVADDLDIDLEVVVGKTGATGTYTIKKRGFEVLERPNLPDYFITGYWPGATNQLIKAANNKGVKFFVFNTAISTKDEAIVGKPRGKYSNWIGHMYPDDVQAGYSLAKSLTEATPQGVNGKKQIAGLAGNADSTVSAKRIEGLNNYIKQNSAVVNLLHIYATDWTEPDTLTATDKLLSTYPNTQAIWTAADSIALYAANSVGNNGRKPGKDILLAGVDWSDVGIQAVNTGVLVSSVGGHFMEGGWALLLMHDYHHGVDFDNDLGCIIQTKMQLIDKTNVAEYLAKFGARDWSKVDFKKLSKFHNPNLRQYDLSLQNLLNQLN